MLICLITAGIEGQLALMGCLEFGVQMKSVWPSVYRICSNIGAAKN